MKRLAALAALALPLLACGMCQVAVGANNAQQMTYTQDPLTWPVIGLVALVVLVCVGGALLGGRQR